MKVEVHCFCLMMFAILICSMMACTVDKEYSQSDHGVDSLMPDQSRTDLGSDTEDEQEVDIGILEGICEQARIELETIRSCVQDQDCGQIIESTSCGCTRDLVAHVDAELEIYYSIREEYRRQFGRSSQHVCYEFPGGNNCDCPEADGFACLGGQCTWNYTQGQ